MTVCADGAAASCWPWRSDCPWPLPAVWAAAPFRWLATLYVEFFRGIPVLILLFFLYYGLPEIGLAIILACRSSSTLRWWA